MYADKTDAKFNCSLFAGYCRISIINPFVFFNFSIASNKRSAGIWNGFINPIFPCRIWYGTSASQIPIVTSSVLPFTCNVNWLPSRKTVIFICGFWERSKYGTRFFVLLSLSASVQYCFLWFATSWISCPSNSRITSPICNGHSFSNTWKTTYFPSAFTSCTGAVYFPNSSSKKSSSKNFTCPSCNVQIISSNTFWNSCWSCTCNTCRIISGKRLFQWSSRRFKYG